MRRLLVFLLVLFLAIGGSEDAGRAQEALNMRDADIRAFIQDVARATGQTFVIDPRVQGKVSIASQESLSSGELFEVLLSTLRANGLVAVPMAGGGYRIAPEEGAAQQPSAGAAGGAGFATQVFRLRTLDAQSAAETIRPLVGRQGVVQANRRGNTLVVADYADNLRRIRTLLSQIDQERGSTEIVTLRTASAREVAQVINQVLASPGDEGGRNALVSVAVVESSNSLVLRGDPAAIRPLMGLIANLDARADAAGDVQVIMLQHADAAQLVPVLQQLVGQTPSAAAAPSATPISASSAQGDGMGPTTTIPTAEVVTGSADSGSSAEGGPRVRIARYPGANAVIIAGDAATQRMLADVVRQLDVRRRQVLVEAIVVEVSDDTAQKLGVQYAIAGQSGSVVPFAATSYSNAAPNLMAITGAVAAEGRLPEDSTALATLRNAAIASLLATNGLVTGATGREGDALFGLIINAVKTDSGSNLLSTPSVMTLDNQQATILVGQEVPVTTGEVLGDSNTNPFRTIQRQDVGVQLEVRPQINAGGTITLYLRQEVSSIAGPVSATFDELILNKREISTTVTIDNGQIVVLGGLIGRDERLSAERIPVLGDIPVLGGLFRSTARQETKTNLMVFIRPSIVGTADEARAVTAPRFGYISDAQAARSGTPSSELEDLVRYYMQTSPPTVPTPAAPPTTAPPAAPAPLPAPAPPPAPAP